MRVTPIQPGNKIELPADWTAELGLDKVAALERTSDGILVHPCPALGWDEIFAEKLVVPLQPRIAESIEVSGDAYVL